MRITFVLAAADLSGGNRVISIYAQHLQLRGHRVTIVSRPYRPVTIQEKALAWLRNQPIPKNPTQGPTHFDHLDGVEHFRIDQHRPIVAADLPDADAVIATWWRTAPWVAALPPRKGAKAYFIQHYEAHTGQNIAAVDATWRLPLHKIIVAQWLVNLAKEKFGDTNVSHVPNAVDLNQFNAPPRDKQPIPIVGLMYSAINFKGCDVSLRAYDLAKQTVPELKLVAFGNRNPVANLPLPIGAEYTMQPPQDHLKNIYARCDAWLFGSRSEGFGLPLLEAMACRTPVIATATGAAPELISGGGGVLVPVEDPRAMAREIVRILQLPPQQWRAMSEAAHAAAMRYSWNDATDKFEAALKELVDGG